MNFKVEQGTLIFAIFNVIMAVLCNISFLGLTSESSSILSFLIDPYEDLMNPLYLASYVLPINDALVMIVSFGILAFAVLLVYGVIKKKPKLVKIYYIYGVVSYVLYLLGAIYRLASDIPESLLKTFTCIAVVALIYASILVMVRLTYKKYESESPCINESTPIPIEQTDEECHKYEVSTTAF